MARFDIIFTNRAINQAVIEKKKDQEVETVRPPRHGLKDKTKSKSSPYLDLYPYLDLDLDLYPYLYPYLYLCRVCHCDGDHDDACCFGVDPFHDLSTEILTYVQRTKLLG